MTRICRTLVTSPTSARGTLEAMELVIAIAFFAARRAQQVDRRLDGGVSLIDPSLDLAIEFGPIVDPAIQALAREHL